MRHGAKSGARALAAAAGIAVALAVAGCTSTPPAAPGQAAAGNSPAAPALTRAQASQVFTSYVATTERAYADGDRAAALAVTSGVQWAEVKADFLGAAYLHAARPLYRYHIPTFYLTTPSGYPQWFVASVQRTLVTSLRAGAARPVGTDQVLMLFEKQGAASRWLLASTSQLQPGTSMPSVATSHGYAETVPLSDGALLARPDTVGALQAAVVDDGPASAAARVVADGPLTTGLWAEQAGEAGQRTPHGDVCQWELEGSNFGKFALRTADGGALVFYAMYLNITVAVPAELDDSSPVSPGPVIPVPQDVRPLLPAGTRAPRVELEVQEVHALAAVDPPASGGHKIQVVADSGSLNYASAS